MPDTTIRINSAPVKLSLFAAQGPGGPAGPAGTTTWSGITGKPTEFPPSAHTHVISDVVSLQTTLNLKAPLASPALTGTPTAPTAATTTNTSQLATTAFVQQELTAGTALAKNLEVFARNETGATLTKGTIVYINGTTGNRPTVTKAQANNDANSAQTIGFVKVDIAHNADGFVIVSGELENVNTGALTGGQQLYLSTSVAGAWTTTKPSAPNHLVYVGIVVRANNSNGIIYVSIQNGYELEELHDVAISTPAAKQVIKRNAGNTLWINEAIAASDVTGLGSLATQSGTFSGTSSGTNTGDQDLSGLLPRLSRITVTDVFDSNSDTLTFAMLETGILDGLRYWETGYGQLYHDLGKWFLIYDDGSGSEYRAEITSSSEEPWALTGWTIVLGAGQPSFTIDPPVLLPINAATGTIALATDQQGRVSPADMIGFGSGVFNGLISDINNDGGFLTAGTGGTLPITRGGTGATTAGLARTALGATATGDALFTALTPAAARTTLELGETNTPTFGGLDLLTAGTTTLNVYNSLSGANFERLSFRWASNIARIGTAKGGTGTARDLALETDGTERVRVLSTGSVGIGTTAPTAALHVVKGATPALTSIFANPAGDVFNQFAAQSGTGEYGVWQDALYFQALASLGNGIRFFIGSTNALQIAAPSGNVGIGAPTPASKLTVTGGDAEVTDATKGLILKTPDGTKRYRVTIDNAGALTTTLL